MVSLNFRALFQFPTPLVKLQNKAVHKLFTRQFNGFQKKSKGGDWKRANFRTTFLLFRHKIRCTVLNKKEKVLVKKKLIIQFPYMENV